MGRYMGGGAAVTQSRSGLHVQDCTFRNVGWEWRVGDRATASAASDRARYFSSFSFQSWKPALAIDFSITSRLRLLGGEAFGLTTPTACQGRNCLGSFWPP